MDTVDGDTADAIAIIGMACRFPGAGGVEEYWKLLESNADAVVPVPEDRFDVSVLHASEPATPGRLISRHGGFIDDLYDFDATFFGIAPREALTMDPQQRVLLHVVWEALEAACIPPASLAGSATGVFVGQATAEYADALGETGAADIRSMAGSRLRAATSGRVSYALDLRGPSLVVDTACSSSLVAVHTARQSLLTGECDLAIAAGVNAVLSPVDAIAYSQGGILSPDGRCKFGDSSADGFVRSEGVGVVLLKRLPDALADGDTVLALLRGSAVTNDGRGSGLLLQPAVSGQAEMLRAAWRSAGVLPSHLDYVEAHGTGTTVGDGVELRALAEALGMDRPVGRPLPVGSVKTNIGHAEAAAGMAGLIKTVLMARRRTIPASLHLTSPHPLLSEAGLPLTVVSRNAPLEPRGDRAVLGVSSFGLSGTNAHVVIGEYVADGSPGKAIPEPHPADDRGTHLLVLTARTPAALHRLAARFAGHLEPGGRGQGQSLRDICHTAATRRDAHPFRMWAVGSSHEELAAVLRALAAGEETPDGGIHESGFGEPRDVAFVFPGQGSQWRGMGRELLAASESFRAAMAECDAAVQEELGWSVVDLLQDDSKEIPDAVDVVQPTLWAVEVALAAHWRGMGVEPDLCIGHSMGEAAAACVTGALSVRDAARVICRRSTLMQLLAGRGAMLATELSADEAREITEAYEGMVCVAAENAPRATVLAGDVRALEDVTDRLERQGVFCRVVKVNVASHSPVMDEIRDELLEQLAELRPGEPRTEMFSTVRCAPVQGAELNAHYWMDNLRLPVRFTESVQKAAKSRQVIFVEISPHPLLAQALRDGQAAVGVPTGVVTTLARHHGERMSVARALGQVFALGARIDWNRWYGGDAARVPLPLYAWDTEHFRAEPARAAASAPIYQRQVRLSRLGVGELGTGVSLRGLSPVPVVVHLAAVTDALRDLVGDEPVTLTDVSLGDAMPPLADASETALRVVVYPAAEEGRFTFAVEALSARSDSPALCVAGGAHAGADRSAGSVPAELDSALTRCGEYVPPAEFYRRVEARGYAVDPVLRSVRQLWRRDGEAVARIHAASSRPGAALEAGLLAMVAAWPHSSGADDATCAYLPVAFERVLMIEAPGEEYWSTARFTRSPGPRGARCDITLVAPDGHVLVDFQGVTLLRLPGRQGPADVLEKARPPQTPAQQTAERQSPANGLLIHAAAVLGTTADRMDLRRPLKEMGLDSLMAAQLRERLRTDLGVDIAISRLLGAESAAGIVADLATAPA